MTGADTDPLAHRKANADVAAENTPANPLWNDPTAPVTARVDALIDAMTLQEKTAQLYGVWVGASDEGGEVAPHQHDMEEPVDLEALLPSGLGQLTRPFGTVPVDPALGALSLARTQSRIAASNRFGIPVRPGPGVRRDRRHPQALRRLLRLPRGTQPRPLLRRSA